MKRIRALGLLLILLSLPIYAVCGTDWTQTEISGDWSYAEHNQWDSPFSGNYSWVEFQRVQSNFNRWSFVIRLLGTDPFHHSLYEIEKVQQFVNMTLVDSANTHKVIVLIGHEICCHILGFKTVRTWITVKMDNYSESNMPLLRAMDVEVHIWRSGNETVSVSYFLLYDYYTRQANQVKECINGTLDPSWFNSVTLTQRVEKQFYSWGYVEGEVRGDKPYEIIGYGGIIDKPYNVREKTLAEVIWQELGNAISWIKDQVSSVLPSDVREWLDRAWIGIKAFGDLTWVLINGIGVILFSNIPLILGAYGLYLVYLIVSCIEKGTWIPLFDHFVKMTELLMSIGHVFITVVNSLVNFAVWIIGAL